MPRLFHIHPDGMEEKDHVWATRLAAPLYVNCVAHATSRLTILRERDIPVTFSLPPSGYRFRCDL